MGLFRRGRRGRRGGGEAAGVPTPPADDRVVELASLPLWQAQLVLHHLWEAGVPTTMSEGGLGTLRHWANEPMARLWVMERRLTEARAALAEVVDVA